MRGPKTLSVLTLNNICVEQSQYSVEEASPIICGLVSFLISFPVGIDAVDLEFSTSIRDQEILSSNAVATHV